MRVCEIINTQYVIVKWSDDGHVYSKEDCMGYTDNIFAAGLFEKNEIPTEVPVICVLNYCLDEHKKLERFAIKLSIILTEGERFL